MRAEVYCAIPHGECTAHPWRVRFPLLAGLPVWAAAPGTKHLIEWVHNLLPLQARKNFLVGCISQHCRVIGLLTHARHTPPVRPRWAAR